MENSFKAPPAWKILLEGRAPWEFAASVAAWPLLTRMPPGDGRSVLVFPGLAANDLSTLPLRTFLRTLQYQPQPWNFGLNFGPRSGVLAGCVEHVKELAKQSERKVSLIGWSLGGIYAREVAKMVPKLVRDVITLGTPFVGPPDATNAYSLFKLLSGIDPREHAQGLHELPPVPTTSILSQSDGIVAWQASVNPPSAQSETIEITSSHVGMGFNPLALYAIADRLAQTEGSWQPFHNDGLRKSLYRIGRVPIAAHAN